MNPAHHVCVSVSCSAQQAYRFISDPRNLPAWASGLSSSIQEIDGQWVTDSPMGRVTVCFVAENELGVLDHDVTLSTGERFYNPFRVIPNDKDCELMFTVFQRTGATPEELSADVSHVENDLQTLKKLLEKPAKK